MKKTLFLFLLLVGLILLAGCFNKSDRLTGQVQSILDNEITLALAGDITKDEQIIKLNGKETTILADAATRILIEEDGKTKEAVLNDIQTGDILSVIVDEDDKTAIKIRLKIDWTAKSQSGAIAKQRSLSSRYVVAGKSIKLTDEAIHSSAADENTLLIEGDGTLTATNISITKSGDTTSEEDSRLYGVNNAVAAINGSGHLEGCTIHSEAEGGTALFSSGENASLNLADISIITTGGSAKGLYAANQGTIKGQDISIMTNGAHSAAVIADGKNSIVKLNDSTLTTAGEDSPCLFSAGTIQADGVLGLASSSPAAIVEGTNTLAISASDITGTGKYGIILHEGKLNSANNGLARFSAKDSLLGTTQDEAMFYVTKTDAEVSIINTELCFESGILIKAEDSGNIAFKAYKQTLTGDIICDHTSTVSLELKKGSCFKGAIDADHTGSAILVLEKGSSWYMTDDSYISILNSEQKDCRNIESNGHTLYYDSEEEENGWLNGRTHDLPGGGKLTPAP